MEQTSCISNEMLDAKVILDTIDKRVLLDEVEELIEKQHNQEEFMLNIVHDLRAHLNIILSGMQFMEQKSSKNDEKDKEYLGMMKKNSFKMLKLINNLLDTTKYERECYQLKKENVNIVEIIEESVTCIDKYSKQKNIELIFDTNEEDVVMAIDVEVMDRIMLNLLSNAIKFSPNDSKIFVNLSTSINEIELRIKDQGIGISKKDQEKIFNRFYQGSKGKESEQTGSGIGLDLVNYLVGALGGTIKLESDEGKGTEFIIKLPINILKNENNIISFSDNRERMAELEFSDIYL